MPVKKVMVLTQVLHLINRVLDRNVIMGNLAVRSYNYSEKIQREICLPGEKNYYGMVRI
jgi:hypothetical protein